MDKQHTYKNIFVSREHLYALGIDEGSGQYYLAIPADNGRITYDERYAIDRLAFERYTADSEAAIEFAERCRNREADDVLIYQPSKQRGDPLRP